MVAGLLRNSPLASIYTIIDWAHSSTCLSLDQQRVYCIVVSMKNQASIRYLTVVFAILITISVQATDFRKTNWGDSMETVKASETFKYSESDANTSLYSGTLAGLDVYAMYAFRNNKLYSAAYIITQEHSNPIEFVNDFTRLEAMLVKKYGEPSMQDDVWSGDSYRDRPSKWGMAVLTGDLTKVTIWNTETTEIAITLTGDNYKANHGITYESKELSEAVGEDAEAKILEAL